MRYVFVHPIGCRQCSYIRKKTQKEHIIKASNINVEAFISSKHKNLKMAENKISIIEYLGILQKEWVQFFWAMNTFPEEYKGKYEALVKDREAKIVDITRKILVASIFSDLSIMETTFKSIFNGKGVPNFIYRSEESKEKIHHFNMVYFFEKARVTDGEYSGVVKCITPDFKTLIVEEGSQLQTENVTYNFNFNNFKGWI